MTGWLLFERKGWIYLQDNFGTKIVLSPANARDVWQVLNKWIERNAPAVSKWFIRQGIRRKVTKWMG